MLHNFQANFWLETQRTIPKEYTYKGTFFKPSDADTPLYSGFLAPAFVTCSTSLGEVLVNSPRAMTYLDIGWTVEEWHIPRNKQQVSEHTADHNHRPWSDWAVDIGQSFLQFREPHPTAVQMEYATPPHVHPTSRYVTACDDSYQAFPTLVLQVTNAGVRRSGYKAILNSHHTPITNTETNCVLTTHKIFKPMRSLHHKWYICSWITIWEGRHTKVLLTIRSWLLSSTDTRKILQVP